MRDDDDDARWFLGPIAALVLGAGLMPLREVTTASNLTFAFMALTIVAAELGGRAEGLATALVSALSLDFFLTRPYLRLAIEDKHDVIAFVGLAACGLIAAGLASNRRRKLAALEAVDAHGELVARAIREWDPTLPVEPQLAAVLRRLEATLPLAASTIRSEDGQLLAGSPEADARPRPDVVLASGDAPAGARPRLAWVGEIPQEGGRIPLVLAGRRVGWLDVWAKGRCASLAVRQTLGDLAALFARMLSCADDARRSTHA